MNKETDNDMLKDMLGLIFGEAKISLEITKTGPDMLETKGEMTGDKGALLTTFCAAVSNIIKDIAAGDTGLEWAGIRGIIERAGYDSSSIRPKEKEKE